MPALYQLDDFDLCQDTMAGMYCLAYVEIKPNSSSDLWQQIEEVSSDSKHRFRHDHVFRGVCLERCLASILLAGDAAVFHQEDVQDIELSSYYKKVHLRRGDAEERLLYNELVNTCLNLEFGQKYGLQVQSLIEYCEKADEPLGQGKYPS